MIDRRAAVRRVGPALARRALALRVRADDRRFRPQLEVDPGGPAIVLSPHLDDAVLSCFSALLADGEVRVVNVFAGVPDPGFATRWDRICGATDAADQARARMAEDEAALAHAGRRPVHLGFLDIECRRFASPPSLAAIDRGVLRASPGASRIYAPAGIGGQIDHLTVRRYAVALAAAGHAVELYAELPYSVTHGWPHWVTGDPPHPFLDVDPYWEPFLVGAPVGPLREARVVRLDDEQAARKLAAMRAYRSQLPALDGNANGILSRPDTHRFEVLWSLPPGRPAGA
jgi:LmbE family N-acetylglucosaminyl deacetylase